MVIYPRPTTQGVPSRRETYIVSVFQTNALAAVQHHAADKLIGTIIAFNQYTNSLNFYQEVKIMLGSKILIKDVYSLPLGNQILYWRIKSRPHDRPVLEWTIVGKGRNLAAHKLTVNNPSSVSALEALQGSDHMVEMDNVDAHLLEQFLEWGWLYPTMVFQHCSESRCW